MAYTKQTFTTGQTLKASDLNTMSQGIVDKQDTLVSGTSIKTINGRSLLGSGNLTVTSNYMLPSPIEKSSLEGKVIACIGDSITAGVNADPNYVKNLATELKCTTKNLGRSGSTLCDGGNGVCNVDKLDETLLSGADIVTILMGINDWSNATASLYSLGEMGTDDPNTIYGAMKMWCGRIMELKNTEALANTKFYFMTPVITSWNSRGGLNWDQSKVGVHGFTLRRLCEVIIEVAAAYEIPVIDLNLYSGIYYNSADDETATQYGGDGLHPNAEGHVVMTQCIIRALTQNAEYKSEESAIYYLLDIASKRLGTELSYPVNAGKVNKIESDQPSEPEAPVLTSISASYTGGDVAVGTAVSSLTGVSVTATYSDGTTASVTGYTLSGTIAEGSNTITVSYQGKTATFTVNGVAVEEVPGTVTWDLGSSVVDTEGTFTFNSALVSADGPKNTAVCLVPIKPNMQVQIEVSKVNGSLTGSGGNAFTVGLSSKNTVSDQLIANNFFVIPEVNIYIEEWKAIKGLGYSSSLDVSKNPMSGSLETGLATVPVTFTRSSDGNVSISFPNATSNPDAAMFKQQAYIDAIKNDMFLVFQGDRGMQVKLSYIGNAR